MRGEEEYKRGLLRLMVHFDMLAGTNEAIVAREHIESVGHGAGNMASHNQAPCEGLWRPTVQIWDRVKMGDLLGEIRNLYGEPLAQIRATKDGVVIALSRTQYIAQGAQCGIVV